MPIPEDYSVRKTVVSGWPVSIVSYKLGPVYRATLENVDPGAWVVKAEGPSKREAEDKALREATVLLEKAKQSKPPTGCLSVPGF